MESPRWLFPFTHGVDMHTIDTVVRLAQGRGATLVAVSLIAVPPERRSQGARLEYIQQSKDFLEAVKFMAARHKVSIDRYEAFTGDVFGSITLLAHERHCGSIVLVSAEQRNVFLSVGELKCLLEEPPVPLVLIRLPVQTRRVWHMYTRFLLWLRQLWERQNNIIQEEYAVDMGEVSWIRTEEHHRG